MVNQLISVLIGSFVLAGSVSPAGALTVTPGRTELRLPPGQQISGTLTVTNDEKERLHISLSKKDWFMLEANKAKKLTIDTWLKLSGATEFNLKPGESREISFTAECPPDAEGELVGMVSFLSSKKKASMMLPMISVSIYTEATGTEVRTGEIQEIIVRRWQNQIQTVVGVKSTGNVHLRPTGTIVIEDPQSALILESKIKEGGPAYPGQTKAYFGEVPADFKLAAGRYSARVTLEHRGLTLNGQQGFTVASDGQIKMDQKQK